MDLKKFNCGNLRHLQNYPPCPNLSLQRYIGKSLLPEGLDYPGLISKIPYKIYLDVARLIADEIVLKNLLIPRKDIKTYM